MVTLHVTPLWQIHSGKYNLFPMILRGNECKVITSACESYETRDILPQGGTKHSPASESLLNDRCFTLGHSQSKPLWQEMWDFWFAREANL